MSPLEANTGTCQFQSSPTTLLKRASDNELSTANFPIELFAHDTSLLEAGPKFVDTCAKVVFYTAVLRVVMQSSSQQMAASIQTAFLSSVEPTTAWLT